MQLLKKLFILTLRIILVTRYSNSKKDNYSKSAGVLKHLKNKTKNLLKRIMEANLYYIQSREISINNCFILFKGSGVF